MAGDSLYAPLVGIIGEGEEERPPHPQRDALARMLLERGAEPYDVQVIYNTHFHGNVLWYLELIYDHTMRLGRASDWDDPEWTMLDMGLYGAGARFLLDVAVANNNLDLAEWILAHGGSPNAAPPRDVRRSHASLYEDALRDGLTEMAALLLRYGASPTVLVLHGTELFAAACMRLDHDSARALAAGHPEYLRDPLPLMTAARQNRADVVMLLLDLGMSPDIEDPRRGNQRALHEAAYYGSLRVAQLLLAHGAEIDPLERSLGTTPLGGAVHAGRTEMIELLGQVSRDIWPLASTGKIERLRDVLDGEPERAQVQSDSQTPLMWLPDAEPRALEIVRLLLSLGADPAIRNSHGLTAADIARQRGLFGAAHLLDTTGA